jgi:hypothetical protein
MLDFIENQIIIENKEEKQKIKSIKKKIKITGVRKLKKDN